MGQLWVDMLGEIRPSFILKIGIIGYKSKDML